MERAGAPAAGARAASAGAGGTAGRRNHPAPSPMPTATSSALSATVRLPSNEGWGWSSSSGAACGVTRNPAGVISSAHASTSATGKPSNTSNTTKLMPHSGTPSRGSMMSAACSSANAIAAYTTATRNTLRRFSSAPIPFATLPLTSTAGRAIDDPVGGSA